MNSMLKYAPLSCVLAATILSGCANLPFGLGEKFGGGAHPRAETAASSPAQAALREGINLYNHGDYNDAIKRLGSSEIAAGPKATQLTALKYMAFSYCVTSRQTLCRQQFEKALKLDPSFDLGPGEHGHPLWGPVFVKAKKR
jgi:hypothetical protein